MNAGGEPQGATNADRWDRLVTDPAAAGQVRAFAVTTAGDGSAISAGGLPTVRSGPLGHAQLRFWRWHQECPPGGRGLLTVWDTWDVADPAGAGIRAVRAAVDRLFGRHEALRTTYGHGGDGTPMQFVRESPVLVPTELPAVPGGSLGRNLPLVRSALGRREFDLAAELPVRLALLVDGDRVRAVVAGFHHTIVDHHALTVLRTEFRAFMSGRALPPGVVRHPIDWAELEHSPAGRRQAARALAGIARTYARIPDRRFFPEVPGAGGAGFRELRCNSSRAAADLRAAAGRHAVTESAVLVAGYLVALALVGGDGRVATRVAFSNRHLEHAQRSVSCLVQDVVIDQHVDTGTRCSAVLKAVAQRCFEQYAIGHYPYDEACETVAGVERERGVRLPVRNSINYLPPSLRAGPPKALRQAAPAGDDAAGNLAAENLAAESTVDWIDLPDSAGYVHDLDLLVVDSLRCLTFHLNTNAAAVAPASAEAIVGCMRHFLAGLAGEADPRVSEMSAPELSDRSGA